MKKAMLFLAVICCQLAVAQFNLEHTYDDCKITRIKLEVSGEKYYYIDAASFELRFFNADHTPWKIIPLVMPVDNPSYIAISNISENDFNSDDLIECSYNFSVFNGSIGTSTQYAYVIDETGDVLFSTINNRVSLDKIDGLPNKIIVTNTGNEGVSAVYSLPDFNLEHTYLNGVINRVNLDVSGEKYYLLNNTTQQAEFYNADHTLWKTVSTPKPALEQFAYKSISAVSETMLNADSLLEFAYSYLHYNQGSFGSWLAVCKVKLINENGVVLYEGAGSSFSFSIIPGLSTKLLKQDLSGGGGVGHISVMSLPSFATEMTYWGSVVRENFEGIGEKYYYHVPESSQIRFHNADHSLWKIIPLAIPTGYYSPKVNHVSTKVFNNDSLIEVSYSYSGYFSPNGIETSENRAQSKIINELGQELFFLDRATNLYVSSITGVDDKLIAHLQYQPLWDVSMRWEKGLVYGIDLQLGTGDFQTKASIVVFPNPASSVINFKSPQKIVNAKIYTLVGSLIKEISVEADRILVDALSAGTYLLRLTDANQNVYVDKIIIAH